MALYSLGNPRLLDLATAEIVAQLKAWGAVTHDTTLLDIGCGIGRLLVALAPEIRTATGIDVSGEMVKAARRRCAPYPNVKVIKGDGLGLGELEDATFDVAIAVDSFPYLRQSGYALVERFFAESTRVLKPRGQLMILNYSYSEELTIRIQRMFEVLHRAWAELRLAGRAFLSYGMSRLSDGSLARATTARRQLSPGSH